MSNANIFQDSTKSIPRSDAQIERVPLDTQELGGRKGHIPSPAKADGLSVSHVPNASGKS